jgi:hypothetical protein
VVSGIGISGQGEEKTCLGSTEAMMSTWSQLSGASVEAKVTPKLVPGRTLERRGQSCSLSLLIQERGRRVNVFVCACPFRAFQNFGRALFPWSARSVLANLQHRCASITQRLKYANSKSDSLGKLALPPSLLSLIVPSLHESIESHPDSCPLSFVNLGRYPCPLL